MLRVGAAFAEGALLLFCNWKEVSSEKHAITSTGNGGAGSVVHTYRSFDTVWMVRNAKRIGTKVTKRSIGGIWWVSIAPISKSLYCRIHTYLHRWPGDLLALAVTLWKSWILRGQRRRNKLGQSAARR